MMPIFLWSTVLTHARHPVLARGRVKTPRAEWVSAAPRGQRQHVGGSLELRHGLLYFSVWR